MRSEELEGPTGPLPDLPPLSPAEMRALSYGSAIGHEFDFPLLAAAAGVPEERLAEMLERLTQVGLLRERPGGDRFVFVHDEQRARVYQMLTASRLRVLHRHIAEAMERLYPDPPPEVIPELGRHFFLGRVPEKSYQYNRRAADLAQQNGRPEEAAHHLERARLDVRALEGEHSTEEAEIAESLGHIYFSTGDVETADRLYSEGLERAGTASPRQRARLLLGRAEVARELLNGSVARARAREAIDLFEGLGDPVGIASAHRLLGRIAFHQGAYREALDEAILALDLLQRFNDPRTLGRLCIDIGNAFAMLGPTVQEEGVEWYRRAIARLSEAGDWTEVARAHLNLASLVGQVRPVEGLEELAVGREFAERAHEPRWVAWSLAMGVEFRLRLGEVEEAERDNQHAKRLLDRAQDVLGLQQVLANGGQIAEKRGQWEEAERAYLGALARAEEVGLTAEAAQANFCLARLRFKTRDLAGAREAYGKAHAARFAELNPPYAKSFEDLGRQIASAEKDPDEAPSGPSEPA
jgi:tetratricopeptide (TPR) repeat protein